MTANVSDCESKVTDEISIVSIIEGKIQLVAVQASL
jgi:hypothetical protein